MGPQRDVIAGPGRPPPVPGLRRILAPRGALVVHERWDALPSDVLDSETADFYGPAQSQAMQPNDEYLIDWFLRTIEIIDLYEPQVLWFDWWIEQPSSSRGSAGLRPTTTTAPRPGAGAW